jgi:hypothetical protein
MADTDSIKNEANTWASLIPEFFYVLIGRAIPGCLFIIGLVYALDKTIFEKLLLNEPKSEHPYSFIFILLLIVSYASGLILSVIGDLLGRIFYIRRQYRKKLEEFKGMANWIWNLALFEYAPPTSWEHNDENGKKIRPQKNDSTENSNFWYAISNEKCDILFQRQHDHVKKKYAPQARSLSQTAAEVQLCIITAAAYIILFPILGIRLIIEKELPQRWILLIVYAAIAIFSLFAAGYRNERFLKRQFSFSAEIKRWEENPEKPKNKNGEWDVIIVGV